MKVFFSRILNGAYYVFAFVCMLGAASTHAQSGQPATKVGQSVGKKQSVMSPAAMRLREEVVYKLLRAGQIALKNDQLTTPEHANAYDLFQSVLTLSPSNAVAKNGLQAILIRYASLIRKELQDGNISGASRYLAVARSRFPHNALLNDAKKNILAARATLNSSTSHVAKNSHHENIVTLSVSHLNARANMIKTQMIELGQRVAASQEGVLIYARSDKEGRWLYKLINKGAVGYRVRGDIKLSKDPKIIIQPPF